MVVAVREIDGAGGPAGHWWRRWTPWITALVLSALFAGSMSGIAFVRKSYQPPVDYPAMDEFEPEPGAASTAPADPAGDRKRLASSPSTRPTGPAEDATPARAPQKPSPSASGSAGAKSPATPKPSETPFDPLAGLGVLLGLGGAK
ncbi:hypothetical protein GCM10010197_37690 [Nocardioides luteus]|uniref:Uncharacterized protein n=1 Tax=Nocardioides luteus TaxID=1844 RepID=A0ABQ5SUV8_9ACTN|nr:hypothetical protein GCM10010197_37690 [Nocardioides luteus]GLJ67942.1 hypothetical protein GCM10017579_19780 [Nocardioides luteus]